MSYTRKLVYDTIRSVDTATATTYVKVGTALSTNASIVKMVNLSNKNLLISIDGSTDVDILPSNGFWLYDVTSDSPQESGSVFVEKGRQYWVKTTDGAAGTGLVYLIIQYVLQV